MLRFNIYHLATLLLSCTPIHAQLIGPVGPTTLLADKTHVCNILDYGGVADNSTDISSALHSAFNDCVIPKEGSRLLVPEGNYLLNQGVVLSNATNWAFQLDGLITAAYGANWTVERELILQGFAGQQVLNNTVNGEGDGEFLLDVLVIVNGKHFTPSPSDCTNHLHQRSILSSSLRTDWVQSKDKVIFIVTQTSTFRPLICKCRSVS